MSENEQKPPTKNDYTARNKTQKQTQVTRERGGIYVNFRIKIHPSLQTCVHDKSKQELTAMLENFVFVSHDISLVHATFICFPFKVHLLSCSSTRRLDPLLPLRYAQLLLTPTQMACCHPCFPHLKLIAHFARRTRSGAAGAAGTSCNVGLDSVCSLLNSTADGACDALSPFATGSTKLG